MSNVNVEELKNELEILRKQIESSETTLVLAKQMYAKKALQIASMIRKDGQEKCTTCNNGQPQLHSLIKKDMVCMCPRCYDEFPWVSAKCWHCIELKAHVKIHGHLYCSLCGEQSQ